MSELLKADLSYKMDKGAKKKKKKRVKKVPKGDMNGDEFEKMFGKPLEEFLEDSEWDIDSLDDMPGLSNRSNVRSAMNKDAPDGIKELEANYL